MPTVNEKGTLLIKNVSASPVTLSEVPGTPTLDPDETFDLANQDPDESKLFRYKSWRGLFDSLGCQLAELVEAGTLAIETDEPPGTLIPDP